MPLQQGEVRGYDFNRSVVEFTMLNWSNVVLSENHIRTYWLCSPVCTENLNPDVMVMKPAEDRV
jgi:hypothetical protein